MQTTNKLLKPTTTRTYRKHTHLVYLHPTRRDTEIHNDNSEKCDPWKSLKRESKDHTLGEMMNNMDDRTRKLHECSVAEIYFDGQPSGLFIKNRYKPSHICYKLVRNEEVISQHDTTMQASCDKCHEPIENVWIHSKLQKWGLILCPDCADNLFPPT